MVVGRQKSSFVQMDKGCPEPRGNCHSGRLHFGLRADEPPKSGGGRDWTFILPHGGLSFDAGTPEGLDVQMSDMCCQSEWRGGLGFGGCFECIP